MYTYEISTCEPCEPKEQEGLQQGLRYNTGKLRYDLLEPTAVKALVEVFSRGAEKYPPRNWEKGMSWTSVLASLKRHLSEFEMCNDFDEETKLLHIAHVAWNAMALTSYYKLAPQYDDRSHKYLQAKKVSLDLDDCIIDFCGDWCKKHDIPTPTDWHFSYGTSQKLSEKGINDFYKTLTPKVKPKDIPFDVHCYITSRSIPQEITEQWIEKNGFPTKPVYSVPFGKSKIDAFFKSGADYHIDDSYSNFVEMSRAGIPVFLLTTAHNIKYDVGYKRIDSFKDFKQRFL